MIIFLYGQDTYRSRQKLNEIIEGYKKIHKSGLNLVRLDMEKDSFEDFKNQVETTPMFKEKKLIILENTFSNQDFIGKILKYKKNFKDNLILFFEEKVMDKKNTLFQFLKEKSKSQEFNFLKDEKLKNWIKKEFQKYKIEISPKTIQSLIDFIGNDSWQLFNEIKKLVTYKSKTKKVEERDINLLIKPNIETDIFKTIDAIAQKNKKQTLSLIHKHLEKGDSPVYLLSMINFQFRNLLIVKSDGSGFGKLKLHPYVVKKTREQARKFSFEELKKIYQKIFEVDLAIKTGKIKPETALDLLISEI